MGDTDQAIRDIIKGAGVVYVGLFLELLIAFVAQVLAARYLSVSGFGGLTTGTAMLNLGSIVAAIGLSSGLTRYLPRIDESEKRGLVSSIIAVALLISVPLGLAVSFGAPFIAREVFGDASVSISIRVFGAAIPFATLLNIALGGIRGQKRPRYHVYIKNVLQPIARFTLIVIALVFSLGQAGFAGAYSIPYVVAVLFGVPLLYRALPSGEVSFNSNLVSRVAEYSFPLTFSGVAGFMYRSLDIFLILYFLDSSAVGIYGVAYAAVSFMGMFSTAFNFIASPIASELEYGDDIIEVMKIFRVIERWLVVASICAFIPLGVFSAEFITLIYQSKYASGGAVLMLLAAGFAVDNVLNMHIPILKSLGHSRMIAFNDGVSAVSNLILNLILIPKMGILGAAIATVVAFLVRDVLAAVEVRYFVGTTAIQWNVVNPTIIGTAYLAVFATLIAPYIPTSIIWLLCVSGASSMLYIVVVLLALGISEIEVMVLRSIEERYAIDLEPIDPIITFLAGRQS